MNRILIETDEPASDNTVTLTDHRAEHIATVLNATPGNALRIGIVDGPVGTGTVTACEAGRVVLACDFSMPQPPSPRRLILLLALPRPKVLKRLWAPLASLGVSDVILTNACRVERNYFDTHWLNPTHYRPLLVEGLQQAGTTHLPAVTVTRRLKPFVEDELDPRFPGTTRLLAHPGGRTPLRDAPLPDTGPVMLAIGPEGGWVDFERALLEQKGFETVSAGARTLRTDVACIALLAILLDRLDA